MVKTCSFFNKGISNKCFKTNEMIQRTAVLPEAARLLRKKTLRLEGPLRRALIIHSIVLHKQLVNAIGLKLLGSK